MQLEEAKDVLKITEGGFVPQWESWCPAGCVQDLFPLSSPWPAASCSQCCHCWGRPLWAARSYYTRRGKNTNLLRFCKARHTNMSRGMLAYTAGVGWVNFFFLGAGGSGMPYFSLLSAALSLYFIWSPDRKGGGERKTQQIANVDFFFFAAVNIARGHTSVSFLSNSSSSASLILDLRWISRFFYWAVQTRFK